MNKPKFESRVILNISVSRKIADTIRAKSAHTGIPISRLIENALAKKEEVKI